MIKKLILPLAILAVGMTSCDVGENKNTYNVSFNSIYNLIVDESDANSLAQVTQSNYEFNEDYNNNTIEIKATDVIIDGLKYSFESDTLALKPKYFGDKVSYKGFSRLGNISKGGASVTNFEGYFAAYYLPINSSYGYLTTNDLFLPNFKFAYTISSANSYGDIQYFFPVLNYTMNNSYRIGSFMPNACFVGESMVSGAGSPVNGKDTGYQVYLDFAKKEASLLVLGLDLGENAGADVPKVVRIEKIPINMTHYNFELAAESPKTTVPGKNSEGKSEFVATSNYNVTDFKLSFTSANYTDLTDVAISYKIAGRSVNFYGSSILKRVPEGN